MSKWNPNKRNSNSNLGEFKTVEKTVHFKRGVKFDERLSIEFYVDESEIEKESVTVTVSAPDKVIKSLRIDSGGIFLKNKDFENKEINIVIGG